MKATITAALSVAAITGASWPDAARANAVLDWNANAGQAAIAACISPVLDPLHESRLYAMMHIAVHDALNAIVRQSRPYAYDEPAPPGASPAAAVAAAARDVLVAGFGEIGDPFPPTCGAAGVEQIETAYAAALAAVTDEAARTLGMATGQAAAAAVLALRAGDGSDTPLIAPGHPESFGPGEYRFTPGFPFALSPEWGKVRPFVLDEASQFRPRPPYPVSCGKPAPQQHAGSCKKYAADFDEVKTYGGDGITTPHGRSADQTEVALFWLESSPLAWNRIARSVAADAGLDAWQSARLLGLLNMALADGYIASFDTKYHYDYWRPITAIRAADADGNPFTIADPTWTPLAQTPPIPDYDSAHAVEGAAAAEVFRRFFGTDEVSFTACSLSLPAGQTCFDASARTRSFTRFSDAARENGESRILVGYHFRLAVESGLKHGKKIGAMAVRRHLRPLPAPAE